MEISEFIDTYSDDLSFLHDAWRALLTHPLSEYWAFSEYLDASFCRILAVVWVGSIDAMLTEWRARRRDPANILDKYFGEGVSNGDRVRNLYQAFHDARVPVDQEIFNDYLATKYLRNTIVHGKWKKHEKEWLDLRGFPVDTRKLKREHLNKIDHVGQNMIFHIFLTGCTTNEILSSGTRVVTANSKKPENLTRLDKSVSRWHQDRGILKPHDIDRIIWNNLEKINSVLHEAIEKTVTHEPYDWTAGRRLEELQALEHAERKRLFYLAARRAGEDDYQLLAQHRELAHDALLFWQDYWLRAVSSSGLKDDIVKLALDGLLQSSDGNVPAEALTYGELAHRLIPNVTPVALLTLYLPIVDPKNTSVYLREANRALRVLRLNQAWYSRAEHSRQPADEGLNFYDRMRQEFGSLP